MFVEDDGFWVRGAATAEIVIETATRAPVLNVELTNGASANAVVIDRGAASEVVKLAVSEVRTVSVPTAGRGIHLRITSREGFRPAPIGSAGDTRYLGVRVKVGEAQ